MLTPRLYMLQRLSAVAMVPLVVGHLVTMIYAIQGGLSAEEILGRTEGSIFWFIFYSAFVLAVAIHGAIGLTVIVHEWFGRTARAHTHSLLISVVFLALFVPGMMAIWGLVL